MSSEEFIKLVDLSDGLKKYDKVESFFEDGKRLYSSISMRRFKFIRVKDHGNTKRIELERSDTFARFEITVEKLYGRLIKKSWKVVGVGKKIEFKIKSKDD